MRYALILAGGSGTRLWPMSRENFPKQLLSLAGGKSLLAASYDRLDGLIDRSNRLVCAGVAHRQAILNALPGLSPGQFAGEPVGRDTLNAIAYGCARIAQEDPDAVVAVLPADHLVEPIEEFQRILSTGFSLVEQNRNVLLTFGIPPDHPSTSYGYLRLGAPARFGAQEVADFEEKPNLVAAKEYLAVGPTRYLWNSGMFIWTASTFLGLVRAYEPECGRGIDAIVRAVGTPEFETVLSSTYPKLKKISVDYAIMERASADPSVNVLALPLDLRWHDIGSWPAFAESRDADGSGNVANAEKALLVDCKGVLVVSADSSHVISAIGCENLVIIHTPEATLVCDKSRAEDIKQIRESVRVRFGAEYV